jgi:3-deoxy-7-phosphoheptulonate synthase
MIIVMKPDATRQDIQKVEQRLLDLGFQTHPIYGEKKTVIGAVGDKSRIDPSNLARMVGVEAIVPIMKPYKLVGRELTKEPSVVDVGSGVRFGGKSWLSLPGPVRLKEKSRFTRWHRR